MNSKIINSIIKLTSCALRHKNPITIIKNDNLETQICVRCAIVEKKLKNKSLKMKTLFLLFYTVQQLFN